MKVLLLGATGRTGKFVLQTALKKGYKVSCLVRDQNQIQARKGLIVYEGHPTNKEDLKEALTDCDAIINVLNISRASDFPWSPLKSPRNLISNTVFNLLELVTGTSVKRIVSCSAWGVRETKEDIPFWFRWLIDSSNIGVAYKDHERQEILFERSSVDWTIVRPVGLTNSSKKEEIQESFENIPKPRLTISRKAVAEYLVDCLKKNELIHKRVVISSK